MSKRRFRFSLASLLIVSTAIVLFLGDSQWRRQRILQEGEGFEQSEARISLPSSYLDYLWQRQPKSADIFLEAVPWHDASIPVSTPHRKAAPASDFIWYRDDSSLSEYSRGTGGQTTEIQGYRILARSIRTPNSDWRAAVMESTRRFRFSLA